MENNVRDLLVYVGRHPYTGHSSLCRAIGFPTKALRKAALERAPCEPHALDILMLHAKYESKSFLLAFQIKAACVPWLGTKIDS